MKGNDGVRIPNHIAAQHIAQVIGHNAQHTTSVQIRDGEGGIGELHVLACCQQSPPAADGTSLGCAMYACVDCHGEQGMVLPFEPNPGDPDVAWYIDSPSRALYTNDTVTVFNETQPHF